MNASEHIDAAAKANGNSLNEYDTIKAYEYAALAIKHAQEAGKLGGDPTRSQAHLYAESTGHQNAFYAARRAYDKAKLYSKRKDEAKTLSATMKVHRAAFIALGGASKHVSRR